MFQSSACNKYYVRWEHYHWCLALRGVGCRHNSFRKLIVSSRHHGTLACVENLFAASPLVLPCFPLQFVVFFVFSICCICSTLVLPCFPPQLVVTYTTFKNYVLCYHIELHFVAVHSTLKNYNLW